MKTLLRFVTVSAIAAQFTGTALAQEAASSTSVADRARHFLAGDLVDRAAEPVERRRAFGKQDLDYMLQVIRDDNEPLRLLQRFEDERADKQVGATSSASGTTTLVSKGTVPKIIGLAVENGAVSQSQSGTTVTFRANPSGAIRAAASKGFFDLTPDDDAVLDILNRLSFSASFDTSRGTADPANTFTGDKQQLSQWTARFQILNRRDVQGTAAKKEWKKRVFPIDLANAVLTIATTKDAALDKWVDDTWAGIQAAASMAGRTHDQHVSDVEAELKRREAVFPSDAQLTPEMAKAFEGYSAAAVTLIQHRQDLLNELAKGALVSLEYTNDRPLHAPKTSNVRLVAEAGGSVDLTANASATLFDTIPVGAGGRLRDVQAAVELAAKLGGAPTVGAFTLSFSGKFSRQFENSFNDAGVAIPDTTGTTAIGQVKLTIPIKGTGIKIPVSLTVANRTELIKESVVRGNIGLTYDLDSIFAKFKPGIMP